MSGKLGAKRTTEEEFKNIQSLKLMGIKNKQIAEIFKRTPNYIGVIPTTGTFAEFKAKQAERKHTSYERTKAANAKPIQPTLDIKIDVPQVDIPDMPEPKRTIFGSTKSYYEGYEAGERDGQMIMLRELSKFVQEQLKLLGKEYGKKA